MKNKFLVGLLVGISILGCIAAKNRIEQLQLTSDADAGGYQISNLGSPTNSSNAATLGYVTNQIATTGTNYATAAQGSNADAHATNTNNPHAVTKSQVGLGSVEDTAISTWSGSTNITTVGPISGHLSVNGNATLGDASGDTVTITAGTVTAANATAVGATAIANVGTLDARYPIISLTSPPIVTTPNLIAAATSLITGATVTGISYDYSVRATGTAGSSGAAKIALSSPSGSVSNYLDFSKKLFFGISFYHGGATFVEGDGRVFIGALSAFVNGVDKLITGAESTDVITSVAHGLTDGTLVILPTLTGGAGLTTYTPGYYVRDKTDDTFKLALTSGGTAVNFTTDISAGSVRPHAVKKGVGWRINGRALYATLFDGTTYSEPFSNATFFGATTTRTECYLVVTGNGSGSFSWYANGTLLGTSSAGPTGAGTQGEGYMVISSHHPNTTTYSQDTTVKTLTFGYLP
jgi:hypothetical protein